LDEAYNIEEHLNNFRKNLYFKPLILKAPPISYDGVCFQKNSTKKQANFFEIRANNIELLQSSRPFLEHISLILSNRPHIVAILDSKGNILEVKDTPERLKGITTKIYAGACINEGMVIDSSIGLALSLKRPVLIYEMPIYPIINLSIPIHNNGNIYGCLSVWVQNEDSDYEYLNHIHVCVSCKIGRASCRERV
jgi:transcriptional regulator of acetoin/glycerol metabolism